MEEQIKKMVDRRVTVSRKKLIVCGILRKHSHIFSVSVARSADLDCDEPQYASLFFNIQEVESVESEKNVIYLKD